MANPITEAERFESVMAQNPAAGFVEVIPEDRRRHYFEGSVLGMERVFANAFTKAIADAGLVTTEVPADEAHFEDWKKGSRYDLVVEFADEQAFNISNLGPAHPSEGGRVRLTFDDGSSLVYHWYTDHEDGTEEPPRDHVSRLMEPIDADEYAGIESIVAALRRMLDSAQLTGEQATRAASALQVLHGTHRVIAINETKRVSVLTSLAAGAGVLFGLVPQAIVEVDAALEVIAKWYPLMADLLEQAIRN